MVALIGLLAQAVRPVGQHDRLDAHPQDRLGVPEVGPGAEGGLFLERKRCQQTGRIQSGHRPIMR